MEWLDGQASAGTSAARLPHLHRSSPSQGKRAPQLPSSPSPPTRNETSRETGFTLVDNDRLHASRRRRRPRGGAMPGRRYLDQIRRNPGPFTDPDATAEEFLAQFEKFKVL
ncbi:NEDD8-activating enzyme E1 catalytic subunit [Tolypocladium paradoxum]|uniref:NEDD8-activating enzyme E1 catalytic subunit n=1 Tax=Tolypocladium paradoxum TaxID=94208 RepID=A0A2S4KL11_9HYPO|nr:NEDD8-activating enzyme E1 catalytic subunit [Tolypocladium paradoxum]